MPNYEMLKKMSNGISRNVKMIYEDSMFCPIFGRNVEIEK